MPRQSGCDADDCTLARLSRGIGSDEEALGDAHSYADDLVLFLMSTGFSKKIWFGTRSLRATDSDTFTRECNGENGSYADDADD